MPEDRNCFADEMEEVRFVDVLMHCPSPLEREKG